MERETRLTVSVCEQEKVTKCHVFRVGLLYFMRIDQEQIEGATVASSSRAQKKRPIGLFFFNGAGDEARIPKNAFSNR